MLAVDAPSTWMVFNALDRAVGVDRVVVEAPVGGRALLAARARRLGRLQAGGQAAFRIPVQPLVERCSRRRSEEILSRAGLVTTPAPEDRVERVPSVNDPYTADTLR